MTLGLNAMPYNLCLCSGFEFELWLVRTTCETWFSKSVDVCYLTSVAMLVSMQEREFYFSLFTSIPH